MSDIKKIEDLIFYAEEELEIEEHIQMRADRQMPKNLTEFVGKLVLQLHKA